MDKRPDEGVHLLGVIRAAEGNAQAGAGLFLVRPMAVRTCEGSLAPLEQAEPLETAKPRRSSAIRRGSVSMPSNRRLEVLETRGAAPFTPDR